MFSFQCSCLFSKCYIASVVHSPNSEQDNTHHQLDRSQPLKQQLDNTNPVKHTKSISKQGHIESVLISGRELHLGSQIPCVFQKYHTSRGESILLWRTIQSQSSMLILHIMFWPSLLFIAGFIGLVFSCVSLQHEIYESEQNRHRRTSDVLHAPVRSNCNLV